MKITAAEIPGANKLYVDYIHNFEALAPYFSLHYRHEADVLEQIERVRNRRYPRIELGRALEKQNRRFGAGKATMDKLAMLALGNANVIITGQQVGLLGGPLYVLYKALTAIKLADRHSRICSDCFVPVFWLAADDADFAEVNHAFILDKNYETSRLSIGRTVAENVPMAAMPLGEEITTILVQLAEITTNTEFKNQILDPLAAAYKPEYTLSEAFGRWLMHWLKDFGVILIDPADPEIKKLATEVFLREIEETSPSTAAVMQTSQQLSAQNYPPQVQQRPGRLNLFYHGRERQALEIRDGEIHTTDGSTHFSKKELADLVHSQPEKFSPNVVLRSVMQDHIFPTIAYVAGPGEIAYFAQLKNVYRSYDIPMPIIYPRKTLTLVEPAIDRILDKYQLQVPEVWANVETHVNRLAREYLPEDLLAKIATMQREWPVALTALNSEIRKVDPTLEKMVENSAGRIASTIEAIEKKVVQAGKRQNETVRQQIYKAEAALAPEHSLQERVHNFTPYLIKYGPHFIERLYEVMDIAEFDHQIVHL